LNNIAPNPVLPNKKKNMTIAYKKFENWLVSMGVKRIYLTPLTPPEGHPSSAKVTPFWEGLGFEEPTDPATLETLTDELDIDPHKESPEKRYGYASNLWKNARTWNDNLTTGNPKYDAATDFNKFFQVIQTTEVQPTTFYEHDSNEETLMSPSPFTTPLDDYQMLYDTFLDVYNKLVQNDKDFAAFQAKRSSPSSAKKQKGPPTPPMSPKGPPTSPMSPIDLTGPDPNSPIDSTKLVQLQQQSAIALKSPPTTPIYPAKQQKKRFTGKQPRTLPPQSAHDSLDQTMYQSSKFDRIKSGTY